MVDRDEAGANEPHHFAIRVYYEDTDAGGIVYYANYLKFAERARTEMLRDYDAAHSLLQENHGLTFVVKHCSVNYHYPARLDDLLDIRTSVRKIGGASINLDQRVYHGDRRLVSLDVHLALLNDMMKPSRLPPALIAALRPQYKG